VVFLRHVIVTILVFLSFSSNAETINATSGTGYQCHGIWRSGFWAVSPSPTQQGACDIGKASGLAPAGYNSMTWTFTPEKCQAGGSDVCNVGIVGTIYSCPSGQNWTLSGSSCTRPDCVAPQVRDTSTGQCVAPPCTAGTVSSGTFFAGWSVGPGPTQVIGPSGGAYTMPSQYCSAGCLVNVTVTAGSCTGQNGTSDSPAPITCGGSSVETGATCQNSNTGTPSTVPTVPQHRPKCLAGEGVLTSSSGTVACVPSGTPSSAPVVRTEKQTQQFPDGSSRTTETTYTKDPVTQVQDTQQLITNTPATGGGAGQAGAVGTTTSSGSTQPSSPTDKEASDFCKANGQLQICKGDMNKEETQIQVRDYIKSLTDPASTLYTSIENAKQTTQSDADLKEQTDKYQAAAEGTFSPDSSSRNSWQSAMESGWFEPVTRQGCQPYSATIGGRTWNLDICPTAEKISVISEYVMWFLLVVGTFVMLTGGAFTRNS